MASPPAWVDYVTLFVAGGVLGYTLGTLPDLSGRRRRRGPYGGVVPPYRSAGVRVRLPLDPDGYDPFGSYIGHTES